MKDNASDLQEQLEELKTQLANLQRNYNQLQTEYNDFRADSSKREQIFSSFLKNSNDLIFVKDEKFRYVLANQALCEFFGLPESELLGKTDFELMPEEAAQNCYNTDSKAITSGEIVIQREKVGEQWFETMKFPIQLDANRIGVAGIIRDVTQHHYEEKALRESEAKYRQLFQYSPAGIYEIDLKTRRFISYNEIILHYMGYSAKELENLDVLEILDPASQQLFMQRLQHMQKGEIVDTTPEFKIRTKHGQEFWVILNIDFIFEDNIPVRAHVVVHDISERRRAEVALKKSEETLDRILELLPVGIWYFDKNGEIVRVNAKAQEIWDSHALTDQSDYSIAHAWRLPDRKKIAADDWAVVHSLKQGKTITDEMLEIRAFSGKMKTILNYSTPLFDPDGQIEGAIVANLDVTELSRAKENFIQSEAKFKNYIDSSPFGIFIANANGDYLEVNQAAIKMTGYSKGELVKMNVKQLIPAEFHFQVEQRFKRLARLGKAKGMVQYLTKQGEIRWWMLEAVKLENDKFLGFVFDMTNLKDVEEKLVNSERNYREIFNSTSEAIIIHDAENGQILDVNDSMLKLYGYSHKDQILFKHISDISAQVYPYTEDNAIEYFNKAKTENTKVVEWLAKKKDGDVFWVEVSLRSSQIGEHGRILAVVRDISERKRAEEENEKLYAQLSQAQKMEAIGRLAGGVAHDFNNMLQAILGYSEMALEDTDPESLLHQNIQEIYGAAERSAKLTSQLLAFARKQTIAPQVINLNNRIHDMVSMLKRLIGEDIELVLHPENTVWQVLIDPSQLDQVLTNLSVNARDAISGCGKLQIETRNVYLTKKDVNNIVDGQTGDFVQLSVQDDGCGIDELRLQSIFDPFYTTRAQGEGTGLGLAMVYGIVKQNNGFIDVYSKKGEGTIFKIYLPRYVGNGEKKLKKSKPVQRLQGDEVILVVEDEKSILKMSKAQLSSLGYTVLSTDSPKEALRLAKENKDRIDLLLTDVVMPEMDGRQLLHEIQKIIPSIRFIYMSGYTADVIAERGVLDQSIEFIQKPFKMSALVSKIRTILDNDKES